jgi:hypothetical protein
MGTGWLLMGMRFTVTDDNVGGWYFSFTNLMGLNPIHLLSYGSGIKVLEDGNWQCISQG